MQNVEDFCVLATIVKTEGSTYQKAGAHMRVFPDGRQEGIISGACAESKILETAKEVARTKQTTLLHIDSFATDDVLFGYGVGCQGRQAILLEHLENASSLFQEPKHEKYICAIIYDCNKSEHITKRLYLNHTNLHYSNIDPSISAIVESHAREFLAREQSQCLSLILDDLTCEISFIFHRPKPILHIFGAGADAIALCELIRWMGWDLHVYEHRPHFRNTKHFAHIKIHPTYELEKLTPGSQHMAIVMTHNFITDLMILENLMREPFAYIGLLGPKKRGEQALMELNKTSASTKYDHIYFPVGLNLGGRSPNELALSIVAELQAVYSGTTGAHLRDL